jgi:hypothetical protein
MKKNQSHESVNHRKPRKRIKQKFPPGWSEDKVRAVIEHYERLTDEELAREIESAPDCRPCGA